MNLGQFNRILRQVLIVPVIALLVLAAALYWQIRNANETVRLIQESNGWLSQAGQVQRLITDEETGLRGYEMTNDAVFLQPYNEGTRRLPAVLDGLEAGATSQEQEDAVEQVRAAYLNWHEGFAVPLIATIKAGGETNDVTLNLQGKQQMDVVRQMESGLFRVSSAHRDERIALWHKQSHEVAVALGVLAIIVGMLIGLFTRSRLSQVSDAFRRSLFVVRQRADELYRSEQKLRTTLASIGDAVITCDTEGRVQTMNTVAQTLTGWTESEAFERPLNEVFDIVSEDTREAMESPVSKVKRLNRVVGLANHTILRRRDGVEIMIDDSGAPIRDQNEEMTGVVLVFRDVTLQRKAQQALVANEKLAVAGRLAATIAHEIHNPLDSVANLLFLMDGVSTPEESAEFLQIAKQELARVTQISRAMLSLYRESHAPVAIALTPMLESVLLLMDRRFQEMGVSVESQINENLEVRGFPAELRQVFTNLLMNAAEAAGRGGRIGLRVESEPSHRDVDGVLQSAGASIVIFDNGPGIPERIQEQLFQPFFTTKGEAGTGLGLWVSQSIMTKHGGTITIDSDTGDDHGTSMRVFLAFEPVIVLGGK